jgi:Tfp pilus assembly protein PilV
MTNRDGFTIVEILLAVLLLSFVVMGFQAVTGEIIHVSARSNRESVASQLVEDRLEMIRIYPGYDHLAQEFADTQTLADFPGLTRTTVVRVMADTLLMAGIAHYTRITVTVSGTGLSKPISRTISLAAP